MSNLHIDQLLNLAYDIAKETFKNQQFTFSMIWSKTWKSAADFKKEPVEDWIADFYVQLQLDPRFVNCPSNLLMLKEFINYSDLKKMDKGLFVEDELLLEEEEEKIVEPVKKKRAPSKYKEEPEDGEFIEKEDIESEGLVEKDSYNNLVDSDI